MSKKRKHSKEATVDKIDIGIVGIALMIWGGLGFLFALHFNAIEQRNNFSVSPVSKKQVLLAESQGTAIPAYQVGPIVVGNPGEVFEVVVRASLPDNHWSFIEVEVLNTQEEYLYSFGQELWRESGRDADGSWRESKRNFDTKLTFPVNGYYYLNFIVESKNNSDPKSLQVEIIKRKGSDLPHFLVAILNSVIGLILVEVKYGVFRKTIEALNNEKD